MVLAVPIQILTRSRPALGLTKALAFNTTSGARAASKASVDRFSKATVQGCSSTFSAAFFGCGSRFGHVGFFGLG
jgi:hypothetical protein